MMWGGGGVEVGWAAAGVQVGVEIGVVVGCVGGDEISGWRFKWGGGDEDGVGTGVRV